MSYTVFVDGQEGTTGLQINEYLAQRSDVEVLKIDADKRKDLAERKRLINASDVTFLCLPDEAAKESVSLVDNPNTCVIDASTAHRVNPAWTFGLPELAKDQRAKIKAAKRIANPGCHATAFILALRPLVEAGLLPAATQIAPAMMIWSRDSRSHARAWSHEPVIQPTDPTVITAPAIISSTSMMCSRDSEASATGPGP